MTLAPSVTDLLVYALVVVCAAFAVHTARHEHLRRPWRRVGQSATGMSAAVVLAAFLVVGLLDSVHTRDLGQDGLEASERLSLLDRWLFPLRVRQEVSYSAPFALHALSLETVQRPDGTIVRAAPRLIHGGKHLGGPSERGRDVATRLARATGHVALLWGAMVGVLVLWRRVPGESPVNVLRRLARGEGPWPFRSMLLTLGALGWIVAAGAALAPWYHILGTDQVGSDVLYRSLKSIRTGLAIGTLTTLVMLPFALLFGLMAGYFRRWVDDVIQYVYTTLSSIPDVLLIAAAVLSLDLVMSARPEAFADAASRADARLLFLCLILGVTSWTGLCRLVRGETLKIADADYVQAARALGVGHFRIMTRHLLPNVMHVVIISVVLDFSGLVLAEAVLSYIGVGVDPATESFGNMINGARLELAREPVVWWNLASAFVFLFALVLAANLFADAVRDAFDPRGGHRSA